MATVTNINSETFSPSPVSPFSFPESSSFQAPNSVYFQMMGMRKGYDNIQEWNTDEQYYLGFNNLPEASQPQSSFNHVKGDWDFTDQQKKDLMMNGQVSDIFNRPDHDRESVFIKDFKTTTNVKEMKPNVKISQLSGNVAASPVADLYYSQTNIQALQNGIRYLVFKHSDGRHIIGEQSINDLIIIMQSIYLQHAQNLIYNIVEQVRDLNEKVLNFAVQHILKEIDMYEKYLKDKSSLPVPMDRSTNVSSKGDRVLEFKRFF